VLRLSPSIFEELLQREKVSESFKTEERAGYIKASKVDVVGLANELEGEWHHSLPNLS
jgi:hypothetical protein